MSAYVAGYDVEAVYAWWDSEHTEHTGDNYDDVVSYEGDRLTECLAGVRAVAEAHLGAGRTGHLLHRGPAPRRGPIRARRDPRPSACSTSPATPTPIPTSRPTCTTATGCATRSWTRRRPSRTPSGGRSSASPHRAATRTATSARPRFWRSSRKPATGTCAASAADLTTPCRHRCTSPSGTTTRAAPTCWRSPPTPGTTTSSPASTAWCHGRRYCRGTTPRRCRPTPRACTRPTRPASSTRGPRRARGLRADVPPVVDLPRRQPGSPYRHAA